ncbi:MAG: hypothetical protein NTV91_02780 [Proteobacteria bacterium]|nr:hypothetical protein [Pseudomonadota bacterium]
MAGADQGHGGDQRLIVGRIIFVLQAFRFERPAQRPEVAMREQLQVPIDDAVRQTEARCRRGERGQLQLQTFDEIARADADRIELLHQQQDALDLLLVMKSGADRSMAGKVFGDLGEGHRGRCTRVAGR